MRSSVRTALVATALVAAAAPGRAEPVFTGQGIDEAARRSIDLVDTHLVFLQRQSALDDTLVYGNVTTRWAPGRLLLADGQTTPGNLSRSLVDFGFGFGRPGKFAFFMGANYDIIALSGPALSDIPGYGATTSGAAFAFIGLGLKQVQVTYAMKLSGLGPGSLGRDAWGNFQPIPRDGNADVPLRPGTPLDLYDPDAGDTGRFNVLTLYEGNTGAFVAFTWAYRWNGRETVQELSEVRAHLQPLRLWAREFVESFGLPAAGLTKLDPLRDYYQESGVYREVGAPGAEPAAPPEPPPTPYEVDLGADDVLSGGFRWRVRAEVQPSFAFRRAEVGWVEDFRLGPWPARLGARAHAFVRNEKVNGAVDSYATLSGPQLQSTFFVKVPLSLSLSYSYNSPDGSTFLPIPDAHVFGVQVIFGDPEASKPLIPLVRAVDAKHGDLRGAQQ